MKSHRIRCSRMSSGVTASNSHSLPGESEWSFVLAAGEVSLPRGERERELCVRTRSWLQRFDSVTLFILVIKVSGLFTQLRVLFSGREWLFCVSFTLELAAFIIAYSQLKRKAGKGRQRSHAGLFFSFVSCINSVSSVFRSWCLSAKYGGILEVRGT